ncbi:hypothetical protein BD324DRAFT_634864 [Kockovaella imperatae]|uniref:Prokaryotic-type class I peptide chain release factors domain-containing protein n=1 Tax=Kockovaella imperatae TaxID=4999 RepID=A0A1Y1UB43_9TREE|nr:hypothetical protein BD324DRAFT_634864 [Kockovaella imperatae]ORX34764.1 hypothetical protein BD324DRAFT_634864 [Kockovaella imperatae]
MRGLCGSLLQPCRTVRFVRTRHARLAHPKAQAGMRPLTNESLSRLGRPQRPRSVCRTCLHCCAGSRANSSLAATPPSPWVTDIEAEHAEILRCCKAKVEEYKRLSTMPLSDSSVEELKEQTRTLKHLSRLAEAWDAYIGTRKAIIELRPHLQEEDESLREMFASEMASHIEQLDLIVQDQLSSLLLPQLSSDSLPAILSLHVGIGGGEAARFLEELAKMYKVYAAKKGWQVETLSEVEGPQAKGPGGNGLRETTMKIFPGEYGDEDASCFGDIMWESGIHRVQRVPPGATVDKMHSSTVSVNVSPIYPDTAEEPLIDPKDVRQEVMRARGAGGQHVNKTESAVRLTHVPTGIVVSMQDSRSQHENRAWAWDVLRARISERKRKEEQERRRAKRADKIKGVFRGDKVRTYNYPQDRVTDHRIGYNASDLAGIVSGENFDRIVAAMKEDFYKRRIEALMDGEEDLVE